MSWGQQFTDVEIKAEIILERIKQRLKILIDREQADLLSGISCIEYIRVFRIQLFSPISAVTIGNISEVLYTEDVCHVLY